MKSIQTVITEKAKELFGNMKNITFKDRTLIMVFIPTNPNHIPEELISNTLGGK